MDYYLNIIDLYYHVKYTKIAKRLKISIGSNIQLNRNINIDHRELIRFAYIFYQILFI